MGRHNPGGGYSHSVRKVGHDHYRIGWSWDRYYSNSRLRFPQRITRDTDLKGAERFAKKWGVTIRE